jgi:crossover junction endodeoxyribonuclease RuvC
VSIVGLDLSLTSTGISIDGVTSAITSKLSGVERLQDIRNQLIGIIGVHEINAAVIEGYAFSARNSQSHKIGELGGVIRLCLFEHGIPFAEVPPTSRAKFATGRGNAAKTEVISSVSARTGLVWSGKSADDECDAWLLEEMGLQAVGLGRHKWPESHLAALRNVDWLPIMRAIEGYEENVNHGNA